MEKAFKLIGIALLAAGASFAVSSCEKEVAAVPEEDVVVETVDFEEITKCDFDDIKEATDEVSKAIESLVKGVAGLYGTTDDFQDEVSYKFQSALFDLFTNAFKGTTGEIKVNLVDVLTAALQITVGHEGFPTSSEQKNSITIESGNGILTLRSKEDYYLRMEIPDWSAYIEDNGKFESGFTCSNTYTIEIGEGKQSLAHAYFAFGKATDDTYAKINITYKGRELGASYNFCPYHLIMDVESLEIWFNNFAANNHNLEGTSDISIKNVDDVIWSLSQITSDTYSYTKENADVIAKTFNDNVTTAYGSANIEEAMVRGKKMVARAINDPKGTGLYRVVVYYGSYKSDEFEATKKIVTPGKVIQVLKDKWEELFGDNEPVGIIIIL